MRILAGAMARAVLCGLVLGGLTDLFAQHSVAALFTLVDENSVSHFDTATQANNDNWQVDGVNQLNQQAFWFRIGNVAEQSVHTLPIGVQGTTDTNFDGNQDTLFVRYNGAGFRIETTYHLDGGLPGSGASDMGEQLSITNLTPDTPLDFHFFQYADFDLQGTAAGDTVLFTNPNTVEQNKGLVRLTETVVTPVPAHHEGAFFNATRASLNDGAPTTLNDLPPIGTPLGPGNVTWAYQWDFLLQPGATFQISKDKNLSATPEPAAILLALSALSLPAFLRRRH